MRSHLTCLAHRTALAAHASRMLTLSGQHILSRLLAAWPVDGQGHAGLLRRGALAHVYGSKTCSWPQAQVDTHL